MNYFEAVRDTGVPSLFLAGGITGCPDWQAGVVDSLSRYDLAVYNPRRSSFDVGDPSAAEQQIRWEYRNLRRADAILFWFCEESLCPIVLFELGAHLNDPKPVFVGCHPGYAHRMDVITQTKLVRPTIQVVSSLKELSVQVTDWLDSW